MTLNGIYPMKKTIALTLVVVISLSGCGWFDRKIIANITGFARTCVDGVSYLQFPSGVSVEYGRDSKVKSC